jgi:hypothetical protein
MKNGLINKIVNFGIRTWSGLMYIVRPIAYFKGKGPFVRNREHKAILRTNFLGGVYPVSHGPGTKYYGKLIKPFEKNGNPVEVSLEKMALEIDVDFRREDGLAGVAQYQILYRVPKEIRALERFGRHLGADPERLREPLKQSILEEMYEIKDETNLIKIANDAQDSLTFTGKIHQIAKDNRKYFGIEVDLVSLEGIKYDEKSQDIIRKKADAMAESQERQIMSAGLSNTLNNYYESVASMYAARGLQNNPVDIWQEAKRFYELDRQHSMTQNPGATVIMGGDSDPRIIPLRRINQPADDAVEVNQ